VWTPRRVLLLLAGLLGFGATYAGYARFLGSVDGLPNLPEKYYPPAADADPSPVISDPVESPTVTALKEAFGPDCAEQNRSVYPFQIEDRSQGVVIASGSPPPITEPTAFVKLSPFSLAMKAKPKPPHERVPGEVVEVTTLHADEAIIQLDRPVRDTKEMLTRMSKIVGMELRAAADNRFNPDRRAGRVLVKNNQRFADPNRWLEFRTPGPLFYRSPDHPDMAAPNAPHLWTAAAVEVVNRDNLPRPLRGGSLPVVPARLDGGLADAAGVVADMALGHRAPPPTATADGMKVYLKPAEKKDAKDAKGKPGGSFAGVRELHLNENVVFNLWTDGRGGFPGGAAPPAADDKPAPPPPGDPPVGLAALVGGLPDGRAAEARLREKSLLTIRTLGPFRYDWEKNAARFDVAPQANPLLPNNVELTRLSALGGQDLLTCQQLDIEFAGGSGPGAAPPAARRQAAGPAFKAMRATGPHVYLAAAAEQLQAQGTALEYTTDPPRNATRTVLRGSPLLVLRQLNKLEAGAAAAGAQSAVPGVLVLESTETPAANGKPAVKTSVLNVYGRGRVELYDEAARRPGQYARWVESLSQSKDRLGEAETDLLVFTGGAGFEDANGSFVLTADTLKLWLAPGKPNAKGSGQPVPARLQGIGTVNGRSSDAVIHDADRLNVWFRDADGPIRIEPPAEKGQVAREQGQGARGKGQAEQKVVQVAGTAPVPVLPPATGKPAGPPPVPFLEPVATLPPRDNPLHLSARAIDVTMNRYPAPADPTAAKPAGPQPPGGAGVRYELAKAVCEDRVVVHQEPNEPLKTARGTDIVATTLHLDAEPLGHRMKVFGTADLLATVQYENVFIAGPVVTLDQPNNRVKVDGRGRLRMPSSTDFSGGVVTEPSEMIVDWTDGMDFPGEKRRARFVGGVQAVQQATAAKPGSPPPDPKAEPTWTRSFVVCHMMDVGFDRPVYFNRLRKPEPDRPRPVTAAKPAAGGRGPNPDDPKVESVVCSRRPDDAGPARPDAERVAFWDETVSQRTGKTVKAQHITAPYLSVDAKDEVTRVTAQGPGETRTLQLGSKDTAAGPGGPPPAPPPGQPAKPAAEEEMKLTVVVFRDQLDIEDRKGILQTAKYRGNVTAYHVPSETVALRVDKPLPLRSIILRCAEKLTVSSYRPKDADEPVRTMRAEGEAGATTDDWDGRGSVIDFDGTFMVLHGWGDRPATMYRRQRRINDGDYQKGNPLKYNTKTGQFSGDNSSGGSFSTAPATPR
jgi:hypothetical protein